MAVLLAVLRWSLSLGAKFYRVVPLWTQTIVFLTLVAQISSLLAFFLPLKIIILLGSERMPRYFPDAFQQVDRDLLIAWLSGATVGFFLLSLVANKLIEKVTFKAAGKLLQKSSKMVLFENQEEVAGKGYQSYSSALAGLVFIVLVLAALFWFYPAMALVLVGYLVFMGGALLVFYLHHQRFKEYLEQKLAPLLTLLSQLGFFLAFAFLLIEFIFLSPPGFITAILSLLASRQVFGRAVALVTGIQGLHKQRVRLDALFFHGKVLLAQQPAQNKKTIWNLVSPDKRNDWLLPLLQEAGAVVKQPEALQVRWLASSQANMPHFLVTTAEQGAGGYLVKLFDANKKSAAQHEATLAAEKPEHLPMPALLLATELERFSCLVYTLPPGELLASKAAKPRVGQIEAQLLALKLPAELVARYLRSRPLLPDRLAAELLERLYAACSEREQTLQVAELLERLPELQQQLKRLPQVLMNPGLKTGLWQDAASGQPWALNWHAWALEPLGAGWRIDKKNLELLSQALEQAAEDSKLLPAVEPKLAQLAAQVFELEKLMKRQVLLASLDLLPAILATLNDL